MNVREQLVAIAEWLGWQNESLSFGLRNAFDALRLYDYAQAHPNLPEMADEWRASSLIAAIGYNPLARPEAESGCEVTSTGAADVARAMKAARVLLDSVAFVAKEGDKDKIVDAIDAVI